MLNMFMTNWDWPYIWTHSTMYVLVGGLNHLEKYEFVNGKDDIPCIMEK